MLPLHTPMYPTSTATTLQHIAVPHLENWTIFSSSQVINKSPLMEVIILTNAETCQ